MRTYWHMQMYPDDNPEFFDRYGKIILLHKKFIGLGDWIEEKNQIPDFLEKMQIGDIVAIKKGKKLIALVEVMSEAYKITSSNQNHPLDWLIYRRDIKVLTWAEDNKIIPMARGTLVRCVDENKETTQVIQKWHQDFLDKLEILGFNI